MSTPAPRKPISNPSNVSPRRGVDSSPGRASPSASVPSTGQGLARSPSIRQSRPVRRSTARMSTSFTPDSLDQDEDERNTSAQLIADLKEQVQRAEQAAEHYRKQIDMMQKRVDDATNEQTAAEERDYQRQTELDKLRVEVREWTRQRRESEISHDSEKRLLLQDRDKFLKKETEMQSTIKRLNEALRNKGLEDANTNRAASFADESTPTHANMEFSALLAEKESVIESLRIELAELHLQAAEQEHVGDGRLQDLEKAILETKMQNARLLEENESFQMLLSEKTLKGDFMPTDADQQDTSGLSSLAEELESATDDPEAQSEVIKKLEAENRQLKDGNKALTLYVDKIIGRILQHPGLEHVIVDRDDKDSPPPPPSKPHPVPASTNKALPPAPAATEEAAPTGVSGFLQRAKSVVSRTGPPRPSRPMSYAQPAAPTAHENPITAPSIPLNRGHRRARSDQAQQDLQNAGAAAVVQQMNRGSPLRTASGGPTSPGISPLSPKLGAKQNYFPPQGRTPSGNVPTAAGSSRNSITSEHSLERERSSTDASSARNSLSQQVSTLAQQSSGATKENATIPGAVMKQNQLRPLRLVNAQEEEEKARKAVNRQSWMGWFRGSTVEGIQEDDGSRGSSRDRTSTWQT